MCIRMRFMRYMDMKDIDIERNEKLLGIRINA